MEILDSVTRREGINRIFSLENVAGKRKDRKEIDWELEKEEIKGKNQEVNGISWPWNHR